jgi:multidrug efflux pump subunit AcrA (membrane-fusion protein)
MNTHRTSFDRFAAALILAGALSAQTVEVVEVISKYAERKVDLPGEFVAYQNVAVRAKVTGFVDKVNVDRGSVVKEGQMLATVVAPELTSQRAEAEAKVQSIESQRGEAEAKMLAAQAPTTS